MIRKVRSSLVRHNFFFFPECHEKAQESIKYKTVKEKKKKKTTKDHIHSFYNILYCENNSKMSVLGEYRA